MGKIMKGVTTLPFAGALALALAGCGADHTSRPAATVTITVTVSPKATAASSPASAAPATAAPQSTLLAGNAHPQYSGGAAGQVSVVYQAPIEPQSTGTSVPIVFRNNTSAAIAHVEVAATAKDPTGKIVASAQAKEPNLLPSSPDSGLSVTYTSSQAPSSLLTTRCRSHSKPCPLQRIHTIQQHCKSLRQTSRALQLPVACRTRQGMRYKAQSRYMRIVSTHLVTPRALSLDLHQARPATSRQMLQIVFSLTCTIKAVRHSWSERQVITARVKTSGTHQSVSGTGLVPDVSGVRFSGLRIAVQDCSRRSTGLLSGPWHTSMNAGVRGCMRLGMRLLRAARWP